jgi:hypothetical protein
VLLEVAVIDEAVDASAILQRGLIGGGDDVRFPLGETVQQGRLKHVNAGEQGVGGGAEGSHLTALAPKSDDPPHLVQGDRRGDQTGAPHHHGGQRPARCCPVGGDDRLQGHVGHHLAIHDEQRPGGEQRPGKGHSPAGPQQLFLGRIAHTQAEGRTVTDGQADLVAVMVQVHHDVAQAGAGTAGESEGDGWIAADGDQWFGAEGPQRPQSRGPAGGEDHDLHIGLRYHRRGAHVLS